MTDTEIELEHIFWEARWQRWENLPRFLLPYYCFSHGYTTKKNKPDWQQAREKGLRSCAANDINNAVLSAVIPETVIVGEIKSLEREQNLTRESLTALLSHHLEYCAISKQEQKRLEVLGLSSTMPKEWHQGNKQNLHIRLNKAEISLQKPASK